MAVRVRIAPSPTGYLHIGTARTALFNWLFARQLGGDFLLRIENTDTTREVAEAVDQIQDTLRWLGLAWDGEATFQLDRLDDCRRVAEQLVADGKAYEDEGAIRFRMPDDGSTAWDDTIRGRIEFPNEKLEDVVLVRSDGRPTYNFASPMEDVWDGITHVIRGDYHISNTPKGSAPWGLRNLAAYALRYDAQTAAYFLLITDAYPHASPLEGAPTPQHEFAEAEAA